MDQTITSATLRADSQAVTLQERNRPSSAVIKSQQFNASSGAVEQFSGMYRVTTTDGSAPIGTFDLVFDVPLDLTLAVFDIVMTPSDPTIHVLIGANGVVFTEALGTSMSGSRVSAWLPAGEVKYLRITITPNHPDTLGGSSYTFGMTSFNAFMVEFQLASELATLPIQVTPLSRMLRFAAEDTPGVLYFLALEYGPFVGVTPGQLLVVPGDTAGVIGDGTASLDSTSRLSWNDAQDNPVSAVPADIYLPTLVVSPTSRSLRPSSSAPGPDGTRYNRSEVKYSFTSSLL